MLILGNKLDPSPSQDASRNKGVTEAAPLMLECFISATGEQCGWVGEFPARHLPIDPIL